MPKLSFLIPLSAYLFWFLSPAHAADVTGNWQATLPTATSSLRTLVNISGSQDAGWKVTLYRVDQSPDGYSAASVSIEGPAIKFSIPQMRATFDGTLSSNGNSLSGTWTQSKPTLLEYRRATKETEWPMPPGHKSQMVAVGDNVNLEVLDWGGTGRPLIFLAGLGGSAHGFDMFAPKFTGKYHVYGITRRGWNASSKPEPSGSNYSATQLGDDVLAVISSLKLDKPILVGHSLAGEELSSIGSRHPEKVSALIYLDAGYSYAFYSPGSIFPSGMNLNLSTNELRAQLDQINKAGTTPALAPLIQEVLKTSIPQLEKDLAARLNEIKAYPVTQPISNVPDTLQSRIANATLAGAEKYTKISPPILAIFAVPHSMSAAEAANIPPDILKAFAVTDAAFLPTQVDAFQAGLPQAHVVRLPNASHIIWITNEADVMREMNAFMDSLPNT